MPGTELPSATSRLDMITRLDIAGHRRHYDWQRGPGCCLSPTSDSVRKISGRYGAPSPKLRVAHLIKDMEAKSCHVAGCTDDCGVH